MSENCIKIDDFVRFSEQIGGSGGFFRMGRSFWKIDKFSHILKGKMFHMKMSWNENFLTKTKGRHFKSFEMIFFWKISKICSKVFLNVKIFLEFSKNVLEQFFWQIFLKFHRTWQIFHNFIQLSWATFSQLWILSSFSIWILYFPADLTALFVLFDISKIYWAIFWSILWLFGPS